MDREKYLTTQRKLLSLARQMYELDVEPFLEAIESAEAIAPIIDPTAFKHGARNLSIIKRLAAAAVVFKRAYPAPETIIEGALDAQSYRNPDAPGNSFIGKFGHADDVVETARHRLEDDSLEARAAAASAPIAAATPAEEAPPAERPPLDPRLTRERAGARAYPLPSDRTDPTVIANKANRQAFKDLANREPIP